MFAKQFDLRAVKQTEYILKASITKDGVSEEEIRLGIADGTIHVDIEKHEIRRNGEVLAKFGDVKLPVDGWSVLDESEDHIETLPREKPSLREQAAPFFGSHSKR